jgi:hypothetical protein
MFFSHYYKGHLLNSVSKRGDFMKTIILGLVSIISLAAFVGSAHAQTKKPIDVIRYKLKEGKQPLLEQLKIGKSWQCKVYLAGSESKYLGEVEDVFRFERYSDMIVNISEDAVPVRDFVFDGKSLTGESESGFKRIYNIRAAQNGDLVVEVLRNPFRNDDISADLYFSTELMKIMSEPVTHSAKLHSRSKSRHFYDGTYAYVYLICPASKAK